MATATLTTQASTDEAEIRGLIASLHQAHHDKDAAAIAAVYEPDADLFTLAPPLAYRGVNLKENKRGSIRGMGRLRSSRAI